MNPDQIKAARKALGLTLEQLATMLGYQGAQRRQMMHDLETGRRPLREPQRRLLEAYLEGYRPADWGRSAHETE
jgi:transcriptional regulator with XRE-family HTH domain